MPSTSARGGAGRDTSNPPAGYRPCADFNVPTTASAYRVYEKRLTNSTMDTAFEGPNITHNEARQAAQQYLNTRLASGAGAKLSSPFTVPEINISRSFSDNVADRKAVAKEIHDACTV